MKANKAHLELVQSAVERALKAGADAAEAFVSDTESVKIMVSGRQVEQVNATQEAGIGLRLLKDQKLVFGSSNDLAMGSVTGLIDSLVRKVPFHTADEFNVIIGKESGLAAKDWAANRDWLSYDPELATRPVQEKIDRALSMEVAGLDFSPKIKGSMWTEYDDSTTWFYIANSRGVSGSFPSSDCSGYVEMSAGDGDLRESGMYYQASARYADFDAAKVGRKAAEKAVAMLGSKPIASCEVPMVIAPEVGVDIFSFLCDMLSADNVQKGRSLFAGKLDKRVAADCFTLIDDGRLKGGIATRPVDGEGVPTQTTPLIAGGTLKTFLFDAYTAKKGKTKSTGNHMRAAFNDRGRIGPTNLYLQPGRVSRTELLAGIKRGFYLDQAIGVFAGIDTTSGDFSIPAAGFVIENGKLTAPVRGISIGGNLFELLTAVDKVASDLTWFGSIGCPTFSVSHIKIGGAKAP
jgi:PmbA protein